jgi:hydrogenase maturation protease
MTDARLLIACVGNIFLGDDAFGVEVARQLSGRILPEGARVVDFGIRGIDLAYALMDGYESVILVDASPRGGTPGTLYLIEPDTCGASGPDLDGSLLEAHGMDPARVLRLSSAMGGRVGRVLLVGCEPEPLAEDDDFGMGLSDAVQSAVSQAVPLIMSLATRLLQGEDVATSKVGVNPPLEEGR